MTTSGLQPRKDPAMVAEHDEALVPLPKFASASKEEPRAERPSER